MWPDETSAMAMVSGQLHPIGGGPVATVYSGLHDGEPVAVKVFPAKFDRRTLTAYERERNRLATVSGVSSILPVRGVELLPDGRHALWMELCAQSLATLARQNGPLTPADVVVLGHALARALAAAHSVGVVHGGVNPHNVLFRASGEPVLTDFGVVLRHAFARDPSYAVEFLPPETARAAETLDQRTDLYGLGTVLHFTLTGQAPHPGRLGEEPGERMLRVMRAPVPAIHRPGVPVELATVVARMLAVDPDHRPRDLATVADQLSGMLPRHPPPPPPPPPLPPPEVLDEAEAEHADGFDGFGGFDEPEPPAPDQSTVDGLRPDFGLSTLAPAGRERTRPARRHLIIAGAVLVGLLIVVLVLVLGSEPDEQATTPRTPPPPAPSSTPGSTAPATVQLELAEPTDLGDRVVLNWTATAPNLDFVVFVTPDGEPDKPQSAGRNLTMTIPVDASRKYCFMVRATDKLAVYKSQPRAIRGAVCRG
jgi:serine/threonine protein kinase